MDVSTSQTRPDKPPPPRVVLAAIAFVALGVVGCDDIEEVTIEGTSVERGSADRGQRTVDRPPDSEETPVVERIAAGERAYSVVLETPRAVGGYLRPGDSVDVSLTVSGDRSSGPGVGDDIYLQEPLVTSVFQDLTIIDVEQRPQARHRQTEEVKLTFSAPPEVVEALEVATGSGELFVSLRHRDDFDHDERVPRTFSEAVDGIDELQQQRRDRLEDMLFGCAPGLRPACLELNEGSSETTDGLDDAPYQPAGARLPAQIPPGHRALTVPVRAPTSEAAMPTSGDRVDMVGLVSTDRYPTLADNDEAGDRGDHLSVDLLQQVQVLAAQTSSIGDEKMMLTVAATPDEVELLMLADVAGRIEALVRPDGRIEGPGNIDDPRTEQFRLSKLLDDIEWMRRDRDRRFEAAVDELPEADDEETEAEETEERDESGDEPMARLERGARELGSDMPRHPVSAALDSARATDRDRDVEVAELWTEAVVDGERMVAIPTDAFAEDTGPPEAGRWIDVVATVWLDEDENELADPDEPPQSAVPMTWTVLQRLAVVDRDGRTVTVSATPTEAHLLAHLTEQGRLRPVLRPLGEEGTEPVERRYLREILKNDADK